MARARQKASLCVSDGFFYLAHQNQICQQPADPVRETGEFDRAADAEDTSPYSFTIVPAPPWRNGAQPAIGDYFERLD